MTIFDISCPIESWMPKYPSDPDVSLTIKQATETETVETIFDESGYSSGAGVSHTKYNSGYIELIMRNHHGTHMDAPAHKLPNGKKIHNYPLDKFINSFELVNLTNAQIITKPKSQITLEILMKNGVLDLPRDTHAIILYTGFCDYFCNGEISQQNKKEKENKFPFLEESAVSKILSNYPSLNIIGIDSFSFDPRGSNSETHRAMFAKDVLPLETLWNLKNLSEAIEGNPKIKKTLYCLPLLIKGGDAAPTRAYAELE